MNNYMNIKAKQTELYQEFRKFKDLTEAEKVAFKAKIAQDAAQRTDAEKEEYRHAIKANVLDIKEKIIEIKEKLDRKSIASA